jgi:hypothetical protein
VEVNCIVGGRKQRLLSRWPRRPCCVEHAGDAKTTMSSLLRKKKIEAVSIDSASWAGLMAWSDGLRRLGCSPLAVSFFFRFLFHFSISDLFC